MRCHSHCYVYRLCLINVDVNVRGLEGGDKAYHCTGVYAATTTNFCVTKRGNATGSFFLLLFNIKCDCSKFY